MKLVTATPNALYCDTDQILTPASCKLLRSKGILGVWRYVEDVSPAELNVILSEGLEWYCVSHAHAANWIPSAAGGAMDAKRHLDHLAALGIPKGIHVAFDLEGPGGTATEVIQHVNAHAFGIKNGLYLPALYVGEGSMLSSVQLMDLASILYWKSCSQLRDGPSGLEPLCGYSVFQGKPFDVTLDDGAGTRVTIDYDSVIEDFKGRLPIGVGG
jgi:hypothetical protein